MTEQNQTPPTPPAAPAQAPTAPAAPPSTPEAPPSTPEAPSAPFAVFPTSASFTERVDREARARLKELGIEDPTQVKSILDEHRAMKEAADKRRQEEMTELEREREARTKAEADLAAERAQHEAATTQASLFKLYAEQGIKNYDYATFAISQARSKAEDPAKFDPAAVLAELKADPAGAAALGIVSVSSVPASTTEATRDTPPAGAAPPTTKAVKDMTPAEFKTHVERLTGYSPR